jgi:hypothetical protein
MAFMAAAFALAGYVNDIYLFKISSSVSSSSSLSSTMVASGVFLVVLVGCATCAVVGNGCPV